MDDPDLSAIRKLEGVFGGIQSFKAERKQLVLAILEVWISDHNAVVREKLRRTAVTRLAPLLSAVIAQGNRDGVFHTGSADSTARVLVGLMQSFGEAATELFVARQAGTIAWRRSSAQVEANTEACERILGLSTGSLTLIDEPALRFWFG